MFNCLSATENRSAQKKYKRSGATRSNASAEPPTHWNPSHRQWLEEVVNNLIEHNKVNERYALHDFVKQEGTAHLVAALCNAGADPNKRNTYPDGANAPLHVLFFHHPPDLHQKTAILLLAGANLELENDYGEKPLAKLPYDQPELAIAVEKIKAAVPQVKQEQEKNRVQTISLVTPILSNGPASIVDEYAFEPVWNKMCPPLFEKYSGIKLTGESNAS